MLSKNNSYEPITLTEKGRVFPPGFFMPTTHPRLPPLAIPLLQNRAPCRTLPAMNIEAFQQYCSSLKGVTEEFPFGENTLVYKVAGKMFVLTDIDTFESINLKADPEEVIERQERYSSVTPGYHMNKKYWITVETNGDVPNKILQEWIKQSYDLVVSKLPRKDREQL
ncbi:Predicted DNA-binding protein, MmcQ/YjbR family [Chitinophaga costaii]|uniref:Predicted DNA-binding protein, MmcQ/YjbR family n=2 Tax=Chitinophaga costaii TaxID=1335309 RepID=A0A1C3ZCC8_9BACT|nr:Predicted DNA-binding protein, MmcQ/YjbR family [Chitinophaga costaii]